MNVLNSEQENLLSIASTFVPLCSLKKNYLEFLLLQQANVEHVCSGCTLVERGVCDYRHMYLLSGQVSLLYASGYKHTVEARDNLGPIVHEMPRPCEVYAKTDCTFLVIESERLDRILSWSQISQYLLSELSVKRDYDEDMAWIQTVLNSNLFYKVPPVNAEQVLGRMTAQLVYKGDVIIQQGEIGSCCYFIKEGEASITRHDESNNFQHLADVSVGRCFGEDALVYETFRNATVKMLTDGVLMKLDKKDFKVLLLEPKIREVSESDQGDFADNPVYIDVRTIAEYEAGHLVLSVNMPLNLLSIEKRLLRTDIHYVLYCNTGRRSRSAAYLLGKLGYQVASLSGGLEGASMQYQLIQDTSYILKDGRVIKAIN